MSKISQSLGRTALIGLAYVTLTGVAAGGAEAATLINGSGNLSEMVHNNGAQSGNTVTGLSQPTGYYVQFTSADTLTTSGNGFAQVDGPFSWVTVSPLAPASSNQGLVGFQDLQFAMPDHNNLVTGEQVNNDGDTFTIIAHFLDGGSQTFNTTLYSNNKYDVVADAGQIISSLDVGGLTDPTYGAIKFGDIRLVSFDAAIPEPATWAMMIVGVGMIGAVMRRRRSALTAG